MRHKRCFGKKFFVLFLLLAMVLCTASCGEEDGSGGGRHNSAGGSDGGFHVVSSIDYSSVTEEDGFTRFTAVGEDGMTIRFEGIGVSVEEDGLVLEPGAKLFSLDYVGKLMEFSTEAEELGYGIDFGFAFANIPSVESMTDLRAALPFWNGMDEKEYPLSVAEYDTGFLAMSLSGQCTKSLKLKELTLVFDTEAPQIFLSDLDPMGEVATLFDIYAIDWGNKSNLEALMDPNQLAVKKIENSNVLRSDIVANIDRSSIVTEGTSTFFSATMSDGAKVRFEGKNIEITDEGIRIHPDSSVTSLDAIGKIYGYFAVVADREQYDETVNFNVGYGYTYSASKSNVSSADEVHTWGITGHAVSLLDGQMILGTAVFEPNFVYISGSSYNSDDFLLSGLEVCYDPTEKVTGVRAAKLNLNFSGAYLEGERYDVSREQGADLESKDLRFYLVLEPDTEVGSVDDETRSINYVPAKFYQVGALRDASGAEIDKAHAFVEKGHTLDLVIGDYSVQMPLETVERYAGAQTMNELVPYAYPAALGELNTLVVPVIWADQTDMANEDTRQLFQKGIGRMIDENGVVTDYSDTADKVFSLSEYFDIASYGKMKITSFMTDWYYSADNFADVWSMEPDEVYANNIMDWVRATYPDMDWSRYDCDGNGYVDSMVILNAGVRDSDEIIIGSYEGALNRMTTYFGDRVGTPDAPRVNVFSNVGYDWMQNGYATVIHEFGHGLGLIDYYDVEYSGIDAVGQFDMQSGSYGDWNAYSKLAVGWMEPQIVQGLASGQSVEYTIGSSALTDDVILIPAAGKEYDGPFGEYVMIDLFSDEGVNVFDADFGGGAFRLKDVVGVRISHVNSNMEMRTEQIESIVNPGTSAEYTIGTIHIANNYTGDPAGRYNIEVIQAGGDNTFTDLDNLDTILSADDFFYAGDQFDAADYTEFFYDGLLDDGSAFGYTVEIVSIGVDTDDKPVATIRVTAH